MKARQFLMCLMLVIAGITSIQGQNYTTRSPDVNQCGTSNPGGIQKRVVGGNMAQPGAWPWQALLLYGSAENFVCSGALIHPSWVLTAAHCINRRPYTKYKIRLGEFDRWRSEGHEQTIEVERIVSHPRHDHPVSRNNDLALVKLKTPATLNRWVRTVCLPTGKDALHKDLTCYATGWGLTKRSYSYSRKLQQAHMPLVTKYNCRKRANTWSGYWRSSVHQITNEMLCGGDDTTGTSTCMGDSGGPYMCRNSQGYWVLQGITSWGSRSCRIHHRYSVFTKVHLFTSWIESVMNTTETTEEAIGSDVSPTTPEKSEEDKAMLRFFISWLRRMLMRSG